MDEETVIGYQKMREMIRKVREHKPGTIYDIMDERDEYKEALQNILNATTVAQMIAIADRVLKENRK